MAKTKKYLKKTRPYNFGAGPAMLPEPVLLEVQKELLNWQDSGMSVMEVGHRTPIFHAFMNQLEADLRSLLTIPSSYHVLFLGGPARTQFSLIPMNLLSEDERAGYLISGVWSEMAYQEAKQLKNAYVVASTAQQHFITTPARASWDLHKNTAYLYYTPNETINGVRFNETPTVPGIPLVADMTSCLLSEAIDVNDFGLIFAGAQKNISIAGLTIVIVRSDLIEKKKEPLGAMLDYHIQAAHHSLYATPPTFACYVASKMFSWIKTEGGINALYQRNAQKAAYLYDYIDASSFYRCRIEKNARSIVNVCFEMVNRDLEPLFLEKASEHGLLALQGHRMVGGLRASIYNAMPMAGVEALVDFMQMFFEENG